MIHPRDLPVRNRAFAVDVDLEPTPSTVPTPRPSTKGAHAGTRGEDRHPTPVATTSRPSYASRGDRGSVRTVRPYRPPYFSPLALALDALNVIHTNGQTAAHP